jgi:hypothetical protein
MITQPSILTIVDLLSTTCAIFEPLDESAELGSACFENSGSPGKAVP